MLLFVLTHVCQCPYSKVVGSDKSPKMLKESETFEAPDTNVRY